MQKSLYFGHPVNTYNTSLEIDLMTSVQLAFPDWHVENPNQQKHQDGYKRAGMDYFFKEVLQNMDGGIFLPFADGKLGMGVYGEAKHLWNLNKGIWTIDFSGSISPVKNISDLPFLSIEETRQRVYVGGKRENGIRGFFD
jgi:hypothetical protein